MVGGFSFILLFDSYREFAESVVVGNQPTLNFLIVAGTLLILTILWATRLDLGLLDW